MAHTVPGSHVENPRTRDSRTSRLALVTTVVTLGLVAIGGYTRGSGSGYGCADRWPLCEDGVLGGLVPRWQYHMVIEWTHRWVAATVGFLAIATAISAYRNYRHRRDVLWPAVAAIGVIGVQAWVGRMVVKEDLDADLVSLHLAISMLVVALVTITTVNARPLRETRPADPDERTWSRFVGAAAAGSIAVLLLGSYVHNLYISGWPLVGNKLLPAFTSRYITVHFAHRVLAAVVAVLLVRLVFVSMAKNRPVFERRLVMGAAACFVLNIALGAGHVMTEVGSTVLVAMHLLLAGLVWMLLVAAAAESRRHVISDQR